MSDGHDEDSPAAILRAAVEEAGAAEALRQALALAGLEDPPARPDEFVQFLNGPLGDALVGLLHPATASHLIATVHERVARVDESHTRVRTDAPGPQNEAITKPPPPAAAASEESYEDLATGAIHERATPAWGIRAPQGAPGESEALWLLISNDRGLIEAANLHAPPRVDVVPASSMAVLKGALTRAGSSCALVVDAGAPSIPIRRAVSALASLETTPRVVLWRMSTAERLELQELEPATRVWVPCDAEVTPEEIMRLLGV